MSFDWNMTEKEMKHLLVQSVTVWLVLVSAVGCSDSTVGSSEKPASSPVAMGASTVTANDATLAANAATAAAKAADAVAATATTTVAKAAKAATAAADEATAKAATAAATVAKAAEAATAATAAAKAADAAAKVIAAVPTAASVNADAAQALFKKDGCTKCHAVDKTKKGPSLKKIAADYKGKADGEAKIVKFMSTEPKIKLDDGSEEDHKALSSKDPAVLKNMADWVLSQ